MIIKGTIIIEKVFGPLPSKAILPSANCKPISSWSRWFNKDDQEWIGKEVKRLLKEGLIETSLSPWWVQVVVVKDPTHRQKKRMLLVTQTIYQYTELDAYPLPRTNGMINNLVKQCLLNIWPEKRLPSDPIKGSWEEIHRLWNIWSLLLVTHKRSTTGMYIFWSWSIRGTWPLLSQKL